MYDSKQIALELKATALGEAYYGNSLRVAKDIPGVTDEERSLLDRCATRGINFIDGMLLQALAKKISYSK